MELVITPLFLAVLLAYILAAPVRYLEKQGLSCSAAILTVYAFFAALLFLACLKIFPSLLEEIERLGALLPEYTEELMLYLEKLETVRQRFNIPPGVRDTLDENIKILLGMLAQRLDDLVRLLLTLVGRFVALFLVPLFTFYILRDGEYFRHRIILFLPQSYREKMKQALDEVGETLGAYLRGVIIVSLSVGVMLYPGLLLLGVDFALFLALFNTLLNIVPYFGPLFGAVPVVIIALFQSPGLAWKTVLLMIIVQQVECQLITPHVFEHELGFHPLVVVIALLLGGIYLGFFGLIFIVPLMAVFLIFYKYFAPPIRQVLMRK